MTTTRLPKTGRLPSGGYKPRRAALADGETLALRMDGSIVHHAKDGATLTTWAPDDPGWAQRAIRFGLQPAPRTIHPSGRGVPNTKPEA
ncbi:MAG: hypothetical protein ABIR11_00290 [Candidatus Limnocylindrales bacterium]